MISDVKPIPQLYRLGSFLKDHNIRGGHRLVSLADRFGQLQRVVRFELPATQGFYLNLAERDNQWSQNEFLAYEASLIREFVNAGNKHGGALCFIDCGADIGTVSMLTYSALASSNPISRIFAYEPNLEAHHLLEKNLTSLGIPVEALNQAVGDFCGNASIVSPEHDKTKNAAFIQPDSNGSIWSSTIDSLKLDPSLFLLLKIDVEGAESNVIRGAVEALRNARGFTIGFEAHPVVMARTKITVAQIVEQIQSIRAVSIKVAEFPERTIDFDRPFFPQVDDPKHEVNVVCSTL